MYMYAYTMKSFVGKLINRRIRLTRWIIGTLDNVPNLPLMRPTSVWTLLASFRSVLCLKLKKHDVTIADKKRDQPTRVRVNVIADRVLWFNVIFVDIDILLIALYTTRETNWQINLIRAEQKSTLISLLD